MYVMKDLRACFTTLEISNLSNMHTAINISPTSTQIAIKMVKHFHTEPERQADAENWWKVLSSPLFSLMRSADYNEENQEKFAKFIREELVPSLGPSPNPGHLPQFDSFCNDDFSPAELSWNICAGKSTIRFGFEPIGHFAGTPRDPFNMLESIQVLSRLFASRTFIDDMLWRHFSQELSLSPEQAPSVVARMEPNEHTTVNTISFDLRGETVPKIYFYPIVKALSLDMPAGELICDAIGRLEINVVPAINIIRAFVHESKAEFGNVIRLECLSFDAINPKQSRIKLYLRTPQTSLRRTQEIYTLGGRLTGTQIDAGLADLRSFWIDVLGVRDCDAELPPSTHRTAGIIFNFELRHCDPLPKPKAYIPTRHYGGTDLAIAQGLSRFFRRFGWHRLAASYMSDLQRAL